MRENYSKFRIVYSENLSLKKKWIREGGRHYQKNEKKIRKIIPPLNKGFQNIYSGIQDKTPQEVCKNQEGVFCIMNTNKPKNIKNINWIK